MNTYICLTLQGPSGHFKYFTRLALNVSGDLVFLFNAAMYIDYFLESHEGRSYFKPALVLCIVKELVACWE